MRNTNKRKASKSRIIMSPRGKTYQVDNISQFARKFNLDRSSVSRVLSGNRYSHKKWVLA